MKCDCKKAIENFLILRKIRPDDDIAVMCLECNSIIRTKSDKEKEEIFEKLFNNS